MQCKIATMKTERLLPQHCSAVEDRTLLQAVVSILLRPRRSTAQTATPEQHRRLRWRRCVLGGTRDAQISCAPVRPSTELGTQSTNC
jgi:hypothetical protein